MRIKVNEIGRSMVEMLGVLAIIGVLSVAGVGTYQYALTAYQAGKIQDVLGKAKTLAQTDSRASHALEVNRFIKSALPEYVPDDKKAMVSLVDGKYHVTAFKLPYKICEKLLQKGSILNDMGISILTRMCGNKNSKTSMIFAFEATPVVESGSHFNGGSGEGTGGSGGNNPNIEPETCPDKQVWRQKEDGTYGCVCRHDYEYGEDCTRCEPPRSWNMGNQSCQCPANRPIWENGTCKCIADTDCQYSGTGFCCDETEQICRQCVETDCDTTKGLTLADGRCACSGRKEWRQDEGDSEPSCKCPVNTPAEANPETCECPDGKDNVDEDGDGINECVTSCPSDTGFTGLRNRTTGNCLCDTSKGYKAESEAVGGVQSCVCDNSRDYYQGPSGCVQCEAMTSKYCHRILEGNENETRDWVNNDIQCSSMDGTSWTCGAYLTEKDEYGRSVRLMYNPTTKTYCGQWQVLKKSGNKFVCGTCDSFPLHRRWEAREGRTDEFGWCSCRGFYKYDTKTKECVIDNCRAQNMSMYSFVNKCVPCEYTAVYANGKCYNDTSYKGCSLCYNGTACREGGSQYYYWYTWWKNTPDYCHANGNYEPSLKKKSEDRCSYEYGCTKVNIPLATCEFNTKITSTCKCSTGGSAGQYCCSPSTYLTANGCSSCPTGQVPNSARTGCTTCEPNKITQNGKCVKCDKGYYPSSQQNRCLACPADRTTDEDGLTCSVCLDSNKVFNMITNKCECPPDTSFEDPVNGNCIFFSEDNSDEEEIII